MGKIIEFSKFIPQDVITREEQHGQLLARALRKLNRRINKVIESSLLIELSVVALKGEFGSWDAFQGGLPEKLEQEIGEGIRRLQDSELPILRKYSSDLSGVLGRFIERKGILIPTQHH